MKTSKVLEVMKKTDDVLAVKVAQFGELIRGIGAGLEAAGKLLVEMLEEDAAAKELLLKAYPEMSLGMLNQLEAVGRGQLHPRLAMTGNAGFQRMRRLPYSDQERYLKEPVALLVDHDGEQDTLLVKVENLTPDQAKQVFAENRVRDLAAQKAYLEDLSRKRQVNSRTEPIAQAYVVHRDGTVEFRAGTRVHRRELMEILQKLV